MNARNFLLFVLTLAAVAAQETTTVVAKVIDRRLKLPAEITPYQQVEIIARVQGFVERVMVDRGSLVKKDELLVELRAPEMKAQLAEHEAKALAVESQRAEAEARLAAVEATLSRLKEAAKTPGAIAANEIVQAEKAADAQKALIRSIQTQAAAARSSAAALNEMLDYLDITAPFDGVITERRVHPGALAGPNAGMLLRLEQTNRLRVVVAVPESEISGIVRGANVPFTVQGGLSGHGTVARLARSLDPRTRTMPVELDVNNAGGALAPGMYAEATWPVRKSKASLLVPPSAVVTTTEKVFVIRVQDGKAEHVGVSKGAPYGDLLEVFGDLKADDVIVKRGSDEIRAGQQIR
ncbi:MAG: efflux RND transporter periplasmic adaptor subunit [Acidobacteria bacterium]|nr:efflux RND transporter periplasmic adaptor subunit [Acidobacteriota bacterium]